MTMNLMCAKFASSLACLAVVLLTAGPAQAQNLRLSTNLAGSAAAGTPTVSAPVAGDFIVAVVDSEPITNHEVRTRVVRLEQQLSAQGAALAPRAELAKQVLERLINERAQINLAKDTGIKADDPALEIAVASVAKQNQMSVDEFRRRVEGEGVSWTTFKDDMRDEIVLGRVREREVDNRVRVSEADIDEFIRSNADAASGSPVVMNLAQIVVNLPDNPSAAQVQAAQAKANTAFDRAKKGEDFAKLAASLSDGAEKDAGGEMGLREQDRYPEAFVAATANLRSGEVAAPIRTGAGFHVLKVLEKRSASMPSMVVAQTKARHILLRVTPQLSESQAVARLREIRNRILTARTDFATEAKNNSQDGSAAQGGDLGWANPGAFVPEFEDVMNALQPGQVSEPLVSRFGVHIIQVNERRQAELSEKEQREQIRNVVRAKKTDEQFATWQQEVRGRAYVEYRDPPLVAARQQ